MTSIWSYLKIKVFDKYIDKSTAFFSPKKFHCSSQTVVEPHSRAERKDFHSSHLQDVVLKHGEGKGLLNCVTSHLEKSHLNTNHQDPSYELLTPGT